MSYAHWISCILGGLTVFFGLAVAGLLWATKSSREAERLEKVISHARPIPVAQQTPREKLEASIARFAAKLRGRMGLKLSTKSQEDLLAGGYRTPYAADIFFALQYLTPLVGILIGSVISQNTFFWILTLAAVGFLVPNIFLSLAVRRRKEKIVRALPDAMDLLVICVNAGLGLDQALLRVGEELAVSHRDIQQEFTRVHLEQRAGVPRLEAWNHLAQRVKVTEITTFVSMLHQTERFGTPIVRALTEFSDEIRSKRRQRAEEAAAKTKVKIVIPLVFFIFPCLFIVLLAPALMDISNVFSGLTK
ncbi:MAG: type II secretion system F family protein [Acidobacteriaceae bacterium]|nr:type II secretion system F family protein [Acidobacteriaceae bacterium]